MAARPPVPTVGGMTSLQVTTGNRLAGLLCMAGGILGALGGIVMALVPPAVPQDRFSYPYTPAGFVVTELVFALSHALVLVGVVGIARSGALGTGRTGHLAAWVAAAGWAALTLCEFAALTFSDSAYPTEQTGLLDTGYGVSTLLIGVGMVVMGLAVRRAGVWTGWRRHVTLASGAAVFVLVLPVVFSGNFVLGRLVLVLWLLVVAAMGYALATA